jgi:HAD superfamily hydrolase (TIGR01549 family)
MSQVAFGGGLDPVLLSEALAAIDQTLAEDTHEHFKRAYSHELARELAREDLEAAALPGVLELLDSLQSSSQVIMGLLTGNYQHTGCQKLKRVGIDPDRFEVRIWGDAASTRPGLVRHALDSTGVAAARTLVIGDTPRDVHCAKANGCTAFAVTTGFSQAEELALAGADVVVENLLDCGPLWAWIER